MATELTEMLTKILEGQDQKELNQEIALEKIRQDLAGAILDIGELKHDMICFNREVQEIRQNQEDFHKLVMDQFNKINLTLKDIKRSMYRVEQVAADNWADIVDIKERLE